MISSSHNNIYSPEIEINPLKMLCGYPCDGVIENSRTHAILSPCGMHMSMYKCIYPVTPRVFSLGTLQQFLNDMSPSKV